MTKFSDLKLDPKVLTAVEEAGYEIPTPIQEGAIPPALEGRDVLGIAQTGTGKTASFTLPMITLLRRGRARARMPRSLVLCPTRELAAQVAENFDTYAKYTRLTKALLIGGVSFGEQDKLIDRGVDVLIATPGRLLDHFERGKLLLTGVQVMVVDEADRMLDMGFIPDIERIFQLTPFTRQTLFFSATMAPEIERVTSTFLNNPARIEVARQAIASETIEQRLIEITPARKDQTAKLKRSILRAVVDEEAEKLTNAIVFCNRKTEVDILSKSLNKHGYDAAPIHGDLNQSQRTKTLEQFRDGGLRILVASDVAARGLDIPAVSHVFNYDLPSHAEDYVHRIGRTGRAGREGVAISLSTPGDAKYLEAIEALLKRTLPRVAPPEAAKGDMPAARSSRRRASSDDQIKSSDTAPVNDTVRDTVADEKPAKTPRRRRARPDDEVKAPAPVTEVVDVVENARDVRTEPRGGREAPEAPAQNAPAPQTQEKPNSDAPRAQNGGRENGRGGERRQDRNGDGRGRNSRIVGMGDHVPEFMQRSFKPEDQTVIPRRATSVVEDEVSDRADDEATVNEKPSRRRGSRRPKADDRTPEQTTATIEGASAESLAPDVATADTNAAGAAVEAALSTDVQTGETGAETEVSKPARKPRTRKTAAKPVEPTEDGGEAPAKPKRTRARKKPVGEAGAADAASEDASADKPAPKPRAKRTRKPAAAKVDVATAPTGDEADTPKPVRRRKKAADTGGEAEAEPAAKPKTTRRRKKADHKKADDAES